MKIFQSSLSYYTFELIHEFAPEIKVNLLRSFGLDDNQTFKILKDYPQHIDKVILDSGVWSKNQNPGKVTHTVYDYGAFLKEHGDKFYCYFNYDEDFNEAEKDNFASKNWDNQKILEDMGLNPVPVLHSLGDDELSRIIDQREKYPLIAIGSNAIGMKNFRNAVKQLYDAGVRVHAFRIGSADVLQGLHAWSSDCSSHAQWTKGGRCVFFDNATKKDQAVSFRPFNKQGKKNDDYYHLHKDIDRFRWFVEEFIGFEFDDLIKNSSFRTFSNSMYFWWLEKYVTSVNLDLQSPDGPIVFEQDGEDAQTFVPIWDFPDSLWEMDRDW
ncbi:hypothetical protein SAMN02745704_00091 [Paucidesulfovibrio gracilis DSM 16080]|uniref:Uncharacterized protein n=1 Tax=Paucidesulfovibrio gracilis DSM 16080 TaxID=1121449 RepID=A0A1T4W1Q9_9BACT|nr:hypothetical protein [Paucidesulfovibrio gracilis]SKA71186.1 hypothetical protein SAMN02745704_00091 [Paucidesulfovibrio gracilis DSM 16080]